MRLDYLPNFDFEIGGFVQAGWLDRLVVLWPARSGEGFQFSSECLREATVAHAWIREDFGKGDRSSVSPLLLVVMKSQLLTCDTERKPVFEKDLLSCSGRGSEGCSGPSSADFAVLCLDV